MFRLFTKQVRPTENQGFGLFNREGRFSLEPVTRPLPPLKQDEVVVKMAAAAINPSDLVFIKGKYGIAPTPGVIPGLEGSGRVVACGGALSSRLLLDRRVACTPRVGTDGVWARYMVTSASSCIPLLPSVSYEEGATLLVNPLSAWLLYRRVKELGAHGVLITVSGGALGSMLIRLGRSSGYRVVALVRSAEALERIRGLGAHVVLDRSDPEFPVQLKEACHRNEVTVALDGAGGEVTQALSKALPKGSKVVLYGSLERESFEVAVSDLLFSMLSYEGFWMNNYAKQAGKLELAQTLLKVQRRLKRELSTPLHAIYPLGKLPQAIATYKENRSLGKTIVTME